MKKSFMFISILLIFLTALVTFLFIRKDPSIAFYLENFSADVIPTIRIETETHTSAVEFNQLNPGERRGSDFVLLKNKQDIRCIVTVDRPNRSRDTAFITP